MQKVYVFVEDGGDGSAMVHFTKDQTLLSRLEDKDPEYFGLNEGYSDTLIFPAGFDLEGAGFRFYVEDEEGDEE